MWSDPLPRWYAKHGRHHLPWRQTTDPWAVLVSEVMLQQTQVARVLPRWQRFLDRWPTPRGCAAASLEEVLREWDGLGYPRRARALHATATVVAAQGWPEDEAGLRALPGVGPYTARALLLFALGGAGDLPPRDVNLARVTARAVIGVESHHCTGRRLDEALVAGRPAGMPARDYAYALFDLGATVCRARRPGCDSCPVGTECASRQRLSSAPPDRPPRRQPTYHGSERQLRGATLRLMLGDDPPADIDALRRRIHDAPAARGPGAVAAAVDGLQRDGLILANQLGSEPG